MPLSPEPRPAGRPLPPAAAGLLGLAVGLAFSVLQLLLLLQPSLVELDPEELYNAGHAAALAQLGPSVLLPLQYRPFCGGCTLDAGLGAALFSVLPASLLTWKLVPVGLGALALGLLAGALARQVSVQAALAFALLALCTPPAWSRLGLVAWGNHYEASTFVLIALAVALGPPRPARRVLLGLVLGLALWVGLSAAFALPVVLLWLVLRREWRALPAVALGLLIGFAPALLRWQLTGQSPFATIYQPGEALPLLTRLPHKLSTLLPPRQLAGLLGLRHPLLGPAAGVVASGTVAGAALLGLRQRGPTRLVSGLLGGWLLVYLLVRFQVSVSPPGVVPTAGDVRYAAPALALTMPLLGLVAGQAWARGSRLLPVLLLGPVLVVGLGARLSALSPPFPVLAATQQRAADLDYFREQASWALDLDQHRRGLQRGDQAMRRVHAYALGRAAVEAEQAATPPGWARNDLGAAWAEGVAGAVVDHADPEADGDRADLLRAVVRLDQLSSAWPPTLRQAAFRQAWWRRVDGGAPDAVLAPAAQPGSLAWLDQALPPDAPPEAEAALWHAAGRRWGRDRAPRWLPTDLVLPSSSLSRSGDSAAFAAGLGEALGEAWGPAAATRPPPGLATDLHAPYQRGVQEGVASRWLTGS